MVDLHYRLGEGVINKCVTINTMKIISKKPILYRFFEVPYGY